mmetsp:Transcript_83135/g.174040  ORF Transcript_83135/g.174040 Transcript_83135/m.174040 type:complete len:373 (+) Transcript_83135:183-1301(+)
MDRVNVYSIGGAVIYQLLCGVNLAQDNQFAKQMCNYCYLIVNTLDKTAIAVDAAWDIAALYGLAKQLGVEVRGSIYTHFHFDHAGGTVDPRFTGRPVPPLEGAKEVEKAGGTIWAGAGDVDTIKGQCSIKGDIKRLQDGDAIECGDLLLHIMNTPGHTPGSVCIFAAPRCLSPRGQTGDSPFKEVIKKAESGVLLTGDTLFVGSCGNTSFPGGSHQEMLKTLSRLSTMDTEVVVCPGHAYSDPWTTIGAERASNDVMMAGMRSVPKPPALPPCFACDNRRGCGPRGFYVGRKVRLCKLESAQGMKLNGQAAAVEFFNEEKGRYAVKMLDTKEEKLLKPDNLEAGTLLVQSDVKDEAADEKSAAVADNMSSMD